MIFDLVVLAALIISSIIAFLRGFIRESLTILGVVGGAFAGLAFGPKLAPQMREWLGVTNAADPKKLFDLIPYTVLADILAYGAVFVVVVVILSIVSHILANGAKALGLGALDRSLGVLFGIARALVLLALLYLPVYMLVDNDTRDKLFGDSRTRPYVESMAAEISSRLPQSLSDQVEKKTEAVRSGLNSTTREKLLNIDVLPDADKKAAAQSDKTTKGYEVEQLQEIQNLIEEKVQQ